VSEAAGTHPLNWISVERESYFAGTRRFSLVSLARYTSPMPPAPSGARISYGPRRVLADKDMSRF